jgi:hypothetical protein
MKIEYPGREAIDLGASNGPIYITSSLFTPSLAFDCPSGVPTSSPLPISSQSVSSPRLGIDTGYAWVASIDAREAMAVSSAPEKKRKWLLSYRKVSAGSRPPLLTA